MPARRRTASRASFVWGAMAGCVLVDPVFFLPYHPFPAGHLARWPSAVETARLGPVAEGLKPILGCWIPRVSDHLYWHPASPNAAWAFRFVGLQSKAPMASGAVFSRLGGGPCQGGAWAFASSGRLTILSLVDRYNDAFSRRGSETASDSPLAISPNWKPSFTWAVFPIATTNSVSVPFKTPRTRGS